MELWNTKYDQVPKRKKKKRLKHNTKNESRRDGRTDGLGHPRPEFSQSRSILQDQTDTTQRWSIIFTSSPFRPFFFSSRVGLELEGCIRTSVLRVLRACLAMAAAAAAFCAAAVAALLMYAEKGKRGI